MGPSDVGPIQPSTVPSVIPPVRLLRMCCDKFLISRTPQPSQSLSLAPALAPTWIEIPQRIYKQGNRQWDFKRSEPISFSVNGLPGINMGDALRKYFTGLDGRDDPMFQNGTGAVSCRFMV